MTIKCRICRSVAVPDFCEKDGYSIEYGWRCIKNCVGGGTVLKLRLPLPKLDHPRDKETRIIRKNERP